MEKSNKTEYMLYFFDNTNLNTDVIIPSMSNGDILQNPLSDIKIQNTRTELPNDMIVSSIVNRTISNGNDEIADFEDVIPFNVLPNTIMNNQEKTPLPEPPPLIRREFVPLYNHIHTAPEKSSITNDVIVIHTEIPSNIHMIQNTVNTYGLNGGGIVLHTEIPSGSDMNRQIGLEISNDNVVKLNLESDGQTNHVVNDDVLEVSFECDGRTASNKKNTDRYIIPQKSDDEVIEIDIECSDEPSDTEDIIILSNRENNAKISKDNTIQLHLGYDDNTQLKREVRNRRKDISKRDPIPNFEESLRTKKEQLKQKLRGGEIATPNIPRSTKCTPNRSLREKIYDKLCEKEKGDGNRAKVSDSSWIRQCRRRKKIWAGLDTPLRVQKHPTSSKQNPIQMTESINTPTLPRNERNVTVSRETEPIYSRRTKPNTTEEYNFVGGNRFQKQVILTIKQE